MTSSNKDLDFAKFPEIRLSKDLERDFSLAIDIDRKFEIRHPDRHYWVRRASQAELKVQALTYKLPRLSDPDLRWYFAVYRYRAGIRMRVPFTPHKSFSTNVSEQNAHWVFNLVSRGRHQS